MKKLLFLLLLPLWMSAQVSTGQEQDFDYGIKNNAAQTVTSAIDLVTQGADGTYGKITFDNLTNRKAFLSTGLIKNGLITINADPTKYDISAGIGIISNFDDPENPVSTLVNFSAITGHTPAYLNTGNITYTAINSSGAIVESASPFTMAQRRDLIILGAVIHSNLTSINVVNNIAAPSNAVGNQLHDFMEAIGALNVAGNKYTAAGSNLQLNKSAGSIFKFGVNFATDWKNPHVLSQGSGTSLTFRYRTQNGTEGSDRINLDPSLYDLSNVLTAVPNNKFTIQTVTMFQTGLTRIQYGQSVYDDLASAQAAIFTRDFVVESNIKENGITRAYVIMRNSTTSLQNTADAQIVEAQKFGGVASGGVALTFANIVAALGYTPENVANKATDFATVNNTLYPSVQAVQNTLKYKKIVYEGDSITAYTIGPSYGTTNYPTQIINYNSDVSRAIQVNTATSGQRLSDFISGGDYVLQIQPHKPTSTKEKVLFSLMIGCNDLGDGTSAATVYNDLKTVWAQAKADGFTVVAIGVTRSTVSLRDTGALALNALIYSDPTLYDYTVKTELILPNPADLTYFESDGIHLNSVGSKKLAQELNEVLSHQINGYNSSEVALSVINGKTDLQAVSATSIIKKGATTTDALLAGGSSLANPVGTTGTLVSNYIPKSTGINTLNNSRMAENATDLDIDSKVNIKGAASVGVFNVLTGATVTYNLAGQSMGSFSFGNASGSANIPTLIGKSVDNRGLFFIAAAPDVNPAADMDFNIRENDDSDFATMTGGGFKWGRQNTQLAFLSRAGDLSILGSFSGSATLIGTPTAPTAAAGTNTTQIATTAFATTADNLKLNNTGGTMTGDIIFSVTNGITQSANYFVGKSGFWESTKIKMMAPITLASYTVATLPAGVQGDTAFVTDATAPTYLGALTGGGSVKCPVFYNGSAWVSH